MARKSSGSSKIFSVIEGILIAIFILFIAGMLFLYFTFSDAGAAPTLFGHVVYQTKAVNMQPAINKDDAVIGKSSAAAEAKAGEVVLCKLDDRIVVARIKDIINENGTLYYNVRFDTAAENDTHRISPTDIIAGDIRKSVSLGRLLSFATSTLGIMLVIIIPSFVIIVLQIITIVNSKHNKEEAVNLDELNDIMRSNDYPEETFLPISQGIPLNGQPVAEGEATEIAFVNNKTSSSPLLEDAPADLDSEKSVSFAGPTAVDIFTEDEEFFAEKPGKKSFDVFDGEIFPIDKPEEKPTDSILPPSPDSVLASEFYGITEEVRSHQEKRRIEEEAASGNAFVNSFDSKADSILSGLDETLVESEESEPQTVDPVNTGLIPDEEYQGDAVLLSDNAAEDTAETAETVIDMTGSVTDDAPGIAAEPIPSEPVYEQTAEDTAVFAEPSDDKFESFDLFSETETHDIPDVQSTQQAHEQPVLDIPSRGEEPVPEPVKTVKVKKVRKKKEKVSVDDLLSMIDAEETKINS